MKSYPRVLTIAGSDSGGGAGIQADIKAISATGSYASSAITAITIQNTIGVESVMRVPASVVFDQIEAVLSDIGADAVKTGMLHDSEVIGNVATCLRKHNVRNLVIDPVMISTSGHRLMEESAISTMQTELFPLARVITPNIPEAELLADTKIEDKSQLSDVARFLSRGRSVSVLLKAGHLETDILTDIFYNVETDTVIELSSTKVDSVNTHGTGCTLSSALASYLAQGYALDEAVRLAKKYISKAIVSGAGYSIGHGHGPVDHFFMLHNRQ